LRKEQFVMTIDRIERIRQRAYELWVAEGRPHAKDIDYWLRAEQEIADAGAAPAAAEGGRANEGEGNRSAARAFNREQTAFARHEDVEAKAREAEKALEGAQGAQLRRAEEKGKTRSHGEDPALKHGALAKAGPAKPRRSRTKSADKT
jgi:Protein of unknown function (DUF2934)